MTTSPAWCETVRRDGDCLLIAPHGGRRPLLRPDQLDPSLRVNDLKTVEFTRELAERIDATAIVNHSQDRNVLDLNRLSQVRDRAPWFLDSICAEVERLLALHPRVRALFVHGWNVMQTSCDLGFGAIESAAGVTPVRADSMAVDGGDLDWIGALRAAGAKTGICVTFGSRYPAAHPDNVVQAFTRRGGPTPAEARLADWRGCGRIAAVQLELGIPLRWPGHRRAAFLDALARVLTGDLEPAGPGEPRPVEPAPLSPAPEQAVQLFDPAHRLALFAGSGRIGKGPRAARLLVFLDHHRIALFVGEATRLDPRVVEPLRFDGSRENRRIRFRGPMLMLDDGRTYFDVEEALSRSDLVEAELTAECRKVDGEGGIDRLDVRGELRIGSLTYPLCVPGFAHDGRLRAGTTSDSTLTAVFENGDSFAAWRHRDGVELRGWSETLAPGGLPASSLEANEREIRLSLPDGSTLRLSPGSCMTVLRPTTTGAMRVTLGTGAVAHRGRTGFGTFEVGVAIPRTASEPERL